MNNKELISEALLLFPDIRPDHFTDPGHCEDCRDHDITLLEYTRENIPFYLLGNPGWDTLCFVNEAGFKYFFPAMVRLAIHGTGEEYYIGQFFSHVTENLHCSSFNKQQSMFVIKVLEYLVEHNTEEIAINSDTDDILNAIERWQKFITSSWMV